MNCFMGYNPLATKQVKVTVWVCEQDGATPVAPSNPSAGDCFIVYATDEAVLSNTPTSAKTYADGEWKDAEGGGGGATFPTFTATYGEHSTEYSCDMTYEEAKANYEANALGNEEEGSSSVCYLIEVSGTKYWSTLTLITGTILEDYDIPEGITEGLTFGEPCIFASDGNYYGLKD